MNNEKVIAAVLQQIRDKRVSLNYSQAFMAEQLGFRQNAYSKLELGRTGLRLGTFLDICLLLHMDAVGVLFNASR